MRIKGVGSGTGLNRKQNEKCKERVAATFP